MRDAPISGSSAKTVVEFRTFEAKRPNIGVRPAEVT